MEKVLFRIKMDATFYASGIDSALEQLSAYFRRVSDAGIAA